eukprot:IDg12188t1
MCEIPDYAFCLFCSREYNTGVITHSALVRTANKRLMELPRAAGLRFCPFLTETNEVHTRATGSAEKFALFYECIYDIQRIGLLACYFVSKGLALPINNKMHRLMEPLERPLLRVGNARWGDSYMNETHHKRAKIAFEETSHCGVQFVPQLLALRTVSLPDPFVPRDALDTVIPEYSFNSSFRRLIMKRKSEFSTMAASKLT